MADIMEFILDNHDDVLMKRFIEVRNRLDPEKKRLQQSLFLRDTDSEFTIRMATIAGDNIDWLKRALDFRKKTSDEAAFAYSMMHDLPRLFVEYIFDHRGDDGVQFYIDMGERTKELLIEVMDYVDEDQYEWFAVQDDLEEKLEKMAEFDEGDQELFWQSKDKTKAYEFITSLTRDDWMALLRLPSKKWETVPRVGDKTIADVVKVEHIQAFEELWRRLGFENKMDNHFPYGVCPEQFETYARLDAEQKEELFELGYDQIGLLLQYGFDKIRGLKELVIGSGEDPDFISILRNNDDYDREDVIKVAEFYADLETERRDKFMHGLAAYEDDMDRMGKSAIKMASEVLSENPDYFEMLALANDTVLKQERAHETVMDPDMRKQYHALGPAGFKILTVLYGKIGKHAATMDCVAELVEVEELMDARKLVNEARKDFYKGLKENLERGTERPYLEHVKKGLASGAVGGGNYRQVFERYAA